MWKALNGSRCCRPRLPCVHKVLANAGFVHYDLEMSCKCFYFVGICDPKIVDNGACCQGFQAEIS